MTATTVFLILLVLGAIGFILGWRRAMASAGGHKRDLHSLPRYYASHVLIFTSAPSILLLGLWLIFSPWINGALLEGKIAPSDIPDGRSVALVVLEVKTIANGLETAVTNGVMTQAQAQNPMQDTNALRATFAASGVALAEGIRPSILPLAIQFRNSLKTQNMIRNIAVIILSIIGFTISFLQINAKFRARNTVEKSIHIILIAAASVAILTTVGIILSLIFNSIEFFRMYSAWDFFFGTTWQPSFHGGSDLGILPLLWGTLYISFIALLVAVPIGLLSAIYLAEYAGSAVRSVAKPLLEILAGIPTIVYGLFALLTVGPFLVDVFGSNGFLGVSWMGGGTAVMTAGLVMGIMLIPFVSSLSDDIINAVPQSLRDGSYGLGATQSETIQNVIIPAALPGIVGAILLAASRAVGETMIVVLGAGAAARLDLNPFEAMTTITAKIVSQLTGDVSFDSPEAMVAFSLGMTLFVITLCLNIIALRIVRKYREQFE